MIIDKKKLQAYIENELNVLFVGERGVGKTATIYEAFKKSNMRIKYFSAPTMDPWTDLVGVPTTHTRDDGKEVLRMVPPEDFADDKYDVIFIDELNRAPKKVKDALMELIQFKSINGKPYNIKMIWAAINPPASDDNTGGQDYDVEPLDPALEDRFQIKIKFPYKVDKEYFFNNYGVIGTIMCEWWNNQPDKIKKEISPRRLSYAAQNYPKGIDVRDILDCGNLDKLEDMLRSISQLQVLEKDYANKEINLSKSLLARNYNETTANYLTQSKNIFDFFFCDLSEEWLSQEFLKKTKVYDYVLKIASGESSSKDRAFKLIESIVNANPKSSFILNNLDSLSKFLPHETQKKLEETKINTPVFTTNNKAEAQILNILFGTYSQNIKSGITMAVSSINQKGFCNLSNIDFIGKSLSHTSNFPTQEDRERMKNLIAFYYAATISYIEATNKPTQVLKKLTDTFMNKQSKVYIFNKTSHIYVKDLGDLINQAHNEYFSGLNSNEIQMKFIESTSKNFKKPNKKMI